MIPALVDTTLREVRRGNREALRLLARDLLRRRAQPPRPLRFHLDAAVAWLCRAQDAVAGGGVSRSYCVAWHRFFRAAGWLPAYPETTGYIIPTLFDCAHRSGDDRLRRRAIAMADWEIAVQMPSGAVQGGIIGMAPTPAVFNTGQVIFGWVRAARETGDARYTGAAERAGTFLVEHQDPDGVWRRGLSQHANATSQTYNTRVAWALVELAQLTGDRRFRDAGVRSVATAVASQLPNGWYPANCLDDPGAPLTHTIAYAMRGILETGAATNEQAFIDAARRTADALLACQRPDGSFAGRYDRAWRPAARWSCLTGNAQIALNCLRLAEITGHDPYAQAAARALRFVASVQDLEAADPGVRGGIAGAYPIFGDYGSFEYLNWAAKFFVDALLLLERRGEELVPRIR